MFASVSNWHANRCKCIRHQLNFKHFQMPTVPFSFILLVATFLPIKVNNAKNCIGNEKLVGLFIRWERTVFFVVELYSVFFCIAWKKICFKNGEKRAQLFRMFTFQIDRTKSQINWLDSDSIDKKIEQIQFILQFFLFFSTLSMIRNCFRLFSQTIFHT